MRAFLASALGPAVGIQAREPDPNSPDLTAWGLGAFAAAGSASVPVTILICLRVLGAL